MSNQAIHARTLTTFKPITDVNLATREDARRMRKSFTYVSEPGDWLKVEDRFIGEVKETKFMSLDTESLSRDALQELRTRRIEKRRPGPGHTTWDSAYNYDKWPQSYYIFATGRGTAVAFSVREIRHYRTPMKTTPSYDVLPAKLLDLLFNRAVLKVGSGINLDLTRDFGPLGPRIRPTLCTKTAVEQLTREVYSPPARDSAGLGNMCKRIYSFNYKPYRPKDIKRERQISRSFKYPPPHRTLDLFRWPLPLPSQHRSYLFSDSLMPLSIVFDVAFRFGVEAKEIHESALHFWAGKLAPKDRARLLQDPPLSPSLIEGVFADPGPVHSSPIPAPMAGAYLPSPTALSWSPPSIRAEDSGIGVEHVGKVELEGREREASRDTEHVETVAILPPTTDQAPTLVVEVAPSQSKPRKTSHYWPPLTEARPPSPPPAWYKHSQEHFTFERRTTAGVRTYSYPREKVDRHARPDLYPDDQLCNDPNVSTEVHVDLPPTGREGPHQPPPPKSEGKIRRKIKHNGARSAERARMRAAAPSFSLPRHKRLKFNAAPGCKYCASGHHDDLARCIPFQEDTQDGRVHFCDYCDSPNHRVRACPLLHSKCERCLARGHNKIGCRTRPQAAHRARFEAAADKGKFTSQRRAIPHWGYHNIPGDIPAGATFVYEDLVALPISMVSDAIKAIIDPSFIGPHPDAVRPSSSTCRVEVVTLDD